MIPKRPAPGRERDDDDDSKKSHPALRRVLINPQSPYKFGVTWRYSFKRTALQTTYFCFGIRSCHPTSWPDNQATKPRIGRNPVKAWRTNQYSKPAWSMIASIPGQIISIGDQSNTASIIPIPWPASRALETISGAKPNKITFETDIATTANHIASRAEPARGQIRPTTYSGTNAQFSKAKSTGKK